MDAVAEAVVVECEDSELLLGVGRGDRGSFHALYQRHSGRMLGYVQHLIGDADQAQDLLQEVFVTVWQKAGQYDPALGAPLSWLFTIVRNKAADRWRARRPGVAMDWEEMEALAVTSGPARMDLRLAVHQALSDLSEDQRRAVDLAYFDDMTYEEVADRLRLPVGTLKSRIRAALGRMRALLEAQP